MNNNKQGITGTRETHTLENVKLDMRLVSVSADTFFPTGVEDNGIAKMDRPFWIAETAVTYELWEKVYNWATHTDRGDNIYFFANAGLQGGKKGGEKQGHTGTNQHPVTNVSWGDTIVWLNALTEYHNEMCETNYEVVYNLNNENLRNAKAANDAKKDEVAASGGNGFRLPTSMEWELAGRWIGTKDPGDSGQYGHGKPLGTERLTYKADGNEVEKHLPDGYYWTPGNYASGAVDNCGNLVNLDVYDKDILNKLDKEIVKVDIIETVAWYGEGATQPVGEKKSNALGLYDMSGNVSEWCFDVDKVALWVTRGGGWAFDAYELQVGDVMGFGKIAAIPFLGFRIVRTS